jgi:hypothetical protein
MTDNSSRGLLIAILIVVGLNLAATLVQTGLLLRSASAIPATAAGIDKTLPAKYTDAELAKIADRVVVPYNKQDMEAVYAAFDEIAKNEIPRDKFDAQLGQLWILVGHLKQSVRAIAEAGRLTHRFGEGTQAHHIRHVKFGGSALVQN